MVLFVLPASTNGNSSLWQVDEFNRYYNDFVIVVAVSFQKHVLPKIHPFMVVTAPSANTFP